jgi:putative ABC transport system permease protein
MATALNVAGLSVAFAAFMVIMMQVTYDRGFDRMHPQADRIFRIEVYDPDLSVWEANINRPLAEAFMRSSPHILAGTMVDQRDMFFSVEADGDRNFYEEKVVDVSPGYTGVFTFDMLEGCDRALEEPDNLLIPESLARRLFAGEPAAGRQLTGGDRTYTVGGVFRDFPRNSSVANSIYRRFPDTRSLNAWNIWNYGAFIRTDSPESVAGLADNFKRTFDTSVMPEWALETYDATLIRLTPLADMHYITGIMGDNAPKASRQTLFILTGIAVVIILIAGINYMNFSMALTPKRIRSINTQKVMGCRGRVLRAALLTESVSVALISFLIALALVARAGDTLIAQLTDADISPGAHLWLVTLTGGVALIAGILAGVYPAWYITSFPPAMVLNGSFGLSPRGRRLRNALISVQFIASFVLIIGSSFMYLQNHFMQHSDLGYDKDRLIVANINSNIRKSRDAVTGRLARLPGVESVTYSEFMLSSGDKDAVGWGMGVDYHDEHIFYKSLPVETSFLDMMGIEVSEGRGFRPEDANTQHGAYVFNEKARQMFGLELNDHIHDAEIIGFIPDVKFASMRSEAVPMAFYAGTEYTNGPRYAYVRVQAGTDMRTAIEHVRSTLREFDDEYLFNVRFFDEVLGMTYTRERSLGALISLFSLVAILISIVGVFGLVVFESEYRRREISLRKVFGSTTGQILVMFNSTYLRILALCFVVAAPAAWYAVSRWLENFAYRTPLYWWVYCAAFAVVAALTVLTVTFQSRRAANANPAESIKAE